RIELVGTYLRLEFGEPRHLRLEVGRHHRRGRRRRPRPGPGDGDRPQPVRRGLPLTGAQGVAGGPGLDGGRRHLDPGTRPGRVNVRLLVLVEPGHQRAQPRADLLDLLVVLFLAALEEVRLARVELLDQLAGERAVLDLAQDAAHLLAGVLVDQPRAAGVA